jgi:threonine dehydrogenase-like Zn-dependent dehydrogenase
MIPFTQYLRPDGDQRVTGIERPPAIEAKAQQIIAAGYVFEAEVLHDGSVSLTITDPDKGDLAIEVCPNGPAIPPAVDRLIEGFSL